MADASPVVLLAVAAIVVVVGLALVPSLARRSGRPRFVVGLCLAAAAVAAAELATISSAPSASITASPFGVPLTGDAARLVLGAHATVQLAIGYGLWLLRPWARLAAMGYLGYLLASFLLWGLGAGRGRDPSVMLMWQLCVLPFLTFSFMYLYRGGRYFDSPPRRPPVSDA